MQKTEAPEIKRPPSIPMPEASDLAVDSQTRKRVAIVPCDDYQPHTLKESLKRGLDLLQKGIIESFAGKRILLKPNLMAAMGPERAQTTHPVLVRAFADLLIEAGADVSVGDNPVFGFRKMTDRKTGLRAQIQGSDAKLISLSHTKRYTFTQGKVAQSFLLPEVLFTFDAVISLPKLKAHQLMGMTGAVKNSYGLVHGKGERKKLHFRYPDPDDFAQMLLDLSDFVNMDLHVVDAIVAADGNGPRFGVPRKVGYLVLGADAIAVDFVLARMIGMPADKVGTLRMATKQNKWQIPFDRIEMVGTQVEQTLCPDFRPPPKIGGTVNALPAPVRNALIRRSKKFLNQKPAGKQNT